MTEREKSSSINAGNITNLAEAKRNRNKALNKIAFSKNYNEPIEQYEAITIICDTLLGRTPTDRAFAFPPSFLSETGKLERHFCFINGQIAIIELTSREVRELTRTEAGSYAEDVLEQAITFALETVGPFYLSQLKNTVKTQGELQKRLLSRAQSKKLDFEDIPAIAEKSADTICRYRLPYDIEILDYDSAMAKSPAWKAYLARTSDPITVCQFLYEVCTGQGSYKQSLWLYGETNTGKSTLANVISDIFRHEQACVMLNSKTELHSNSRFLVAKMYGSALVCWDDAHPALASNFEFKGITGNRKQSLERKGIDAVQVTLSCRHMITSNPRPEYRLDDENEAKAMAARFVEVEILPGEKIDDWEAWKNALKDEFQWVLAAGRRAFLDKHIQSKCEERINAQIVKSYGQNDMNDFLSDFRFCKGMNLQVKNLRSYLNARGFNQNKDINTFKLLLIQHFKTREIRRDSVRLIEDVIML